MLPPSPQQKTIASFSPVSRFWIREMISLISIGAVFYCLFVDIDSQALHAYYFAAFPIYRIEAVDYPATRSADSYGNYPHTMILYSPVMFLMKAVLYYVRSVFNIL
jgi:hypothetical protein